MTITDTLRLLIAADIPTDLTTIETSMREITARGHTLRTMALARCRKIHDLPPWRVYPCHECDQNVRTSPGGSP